MLIQNQENQEKYAVYAIYYSQLGTQYIIFEDDVQLACIVRSGDYNILDATPSSHWITTNENNLIPKSWDYPMFLEVLVDNPAPLEDDIFRQAKEAIDQEFPDYFIDHTLEYQDAGLALIAEAIGDDWVLCPECKEAFEVNPKQGVIKCTGCYTEMNNPYAKKAEN